MGIEERLAALKARVLAAEGRLAIHNPRNSFGPRVDSATLNGSDASHEAMRKVLAI